MPDDLSVPLDMVCVQSHCARKRACARIVENMAKLVEDPRDVASFLPKLLPHFESAKGSVADPECREVCTKAYENLKKKGDTSRVHQSFNVADMLSFFASIATAPENQAVLSYVAEICITLNDCNNFKAEEWAANIVPYVQPSLPTTKSRLMPLLLPSLPRL